MEIAVASDQDQVVQQVTELFQRARQHRRSLIQQWYRAYHLLHGRTWSSARDRWMPNPELPWLFPVVASMVGWVSDSRPTYEATPADPDLSQYAELMGILADDLQAAMQAAWENNRFSSDLEVMLFDAFTYGIGFLKTGWDATLAGGMGDVTQRRVDPFTLYLDPAARRWDQVNHFVEVSNITIQELDRRWPGSAAKIDPQRSWRQDVEMAPTHLDERGVPATPLATPGATPGGSTRWGIPGQSRGLSSTDEQDVVTVFEAWIRKHGRDSDGRLIDAWRCIVVCGNQVLFDHPAVELFEHGQHPYARYVPMDTGDIYSDSLVLLLASAQTSINRILAALEHNIWLTGNPVFLEDAQSGISRTRIPNKPGVRLTKTGEGQAGWMPPPQPHPQIAGDMLTFYRGSIENISGLTAINQGFMPGGRNAEGVMTSVQESGFGRVRAAQRNLEYTLSEAGDKMASLITEFYDEPRLIAFGFDDERNVKALQANHWYLPGSSKELPLRFRLHIVGGSSLPTSPNARAQMGMTLLGLGAIDNEAVLELLRFPGRRRITERIRKLQAAGQFNPPNQRQRR